MKLDRKLSNAELLDSGASPEYWSIIRKYCRTPDYKASRRPHYAVDGPFDGTRIWLDDAKTGPIRVGDAYGYYSRVADGTSWEEGRVKWVTLL